MKIIIENRTKDLSHCECLDYIQRVMSKGKVSNNNKQHCYLTVFGISNISVATYLNKKSERFVVYDSEK